MISTNDLCVKKQTWTSDRVNLRLVVGSDRAHTAHLEVRDTREMIELLATDWPTVYSSTAFHSDLGQRIHEAICGWSELYGDDEEVYPEGWKWLGMIASGREGRGDKPDLRWSLTLMDQNALWVSLDAEEIDSQALQACRDVYKAVANIIGQADCRY